MTEKPSPSVDIKNQKIDRFNKRINATLGGAAGTLILLEAIAGVRYSQEVPNASIEKVAESMIRHNKVAFDNLLQLDRCTPLSDPGDINRLSESVIHSSETDAEDIAKRNNIELMDFSYIVALGDTLQNATSKEEITGAVNELTQTQMGLNIHAEGIHKDQSVNAEDYKHKMWLFTLTLRDISKTVLDKLEIEDITIRPEDSDNTNAVAQYNQMTRSVAIDLEKLDSPGTVLHEIIGHGAHAVTCDDTSINDRLFMTYNPSNYQYTNDEWRSTQYAQNDYADNYATKNVLEDYAQTTQKYFTGEIKANLEHPSSPLDKKVMLILDRLNKLAPGSAEYLSSQIYRFGTFEHAHTQRIAQANAKK